MAIKQMVIDFDEKGKMKGLSLIHHELEKGVSLFFYDPPIKWNPKIPSPNMKTVHGPKDKLVKRKRKG